MIPAGGCSLDETGGPWEAVGWAIEQLERAWVPVELYLDPVCHAYIPFRVDQFIEGLIVAMANAPGKRFLEVGCGIGTKLMIASRMGLDVAGIENREQYVAVAKHLCPEAAIELADARWYGGYRGFDIVYSYLPLHDPAAELAYEARLMSEMRPGSVLIAPMIRSRPETEPLDTHAMVWRI